MGIDKVIEYLFNEKIPYERLTPEAKKRVDGLLKLIQEARIVSYIEGYEDCVIMRPPRYTPDEKAKLKALKGEKDNG